MRHATCISRPQFRRTAPTGTGVQALPPPLASLFVSAYSLRSYELSKRLATGNAMALSELSWCCQLNLPLSPSTWQHLEPRAAPLPATALFVCKKFGQREPGNEVVLKANTVRLSHRLESHFPRSETRAAGYSFASSCFNPAPNQKGGNRSSFDRFGGG